MIKIGTGRYAMTFTSGGLACIALCVLLSAYALHTMGQPSIEERYVGRAFRLPGVFGGNIVAIANGRAVVVIRNNENQNSVHMMSIQEVDSLLRRDEISPLSLGR